jgi:predicted ester cyclase
MPIKTIMAVGDQKAVYLIFEGTHTGTPNHGVPETKKTVKFSLIML